MSKLNRLADSVAAKLWRRAGERICGHAYLRSPQNLRDECDIATGSDLDCTQLDILTDMVKARIEALKSAKSTLPNTR
jgi:hypothetical protein